MESVFDPSVIDFSLLDLSLFNCVGFSCAGFSCVGLSNVGFSNVGESGTGWGWFVNDVIRPRRRLAVTLTGTHDIARLFQLLNRRPDRVDLLPVDKGQAFQRKIPILRQGQHLRQQPLGFQGQVLVPQVVLDITV